MARLVDLATLAAAIYGISRERRRRQAVDRQAPKAAVPAATTTETTEDFPFKNWQPKPKEKEPAPAPVKQAVPGLPAGLTAPKEKEPAPAPAPAPAVPLPVAPAAGRKKPKPFTKFLAGLGIVSKEPKPRQKDIIARQAERLAKEPAPILPEVPKTDPASWPKAFRDAPFALSTKYKAETEKPLAEAEAARAKAELLGEQAETEQAIRDPKVDKLLAEAVRLEAAGKRDLAEAKIAQAKGRYFDAYAYWLRHRGPIDLRKAEISFEAAVEAARIAAAAEMAKAKSKTDAMPTEKRQEYARLLSLATEKTALGEWKYNTYEAAKSLTGAVDIGLPYGVIPKDPRNIVDQERERLLKNPISPNARSLLTNFNAVVEEVRKLQAAGTFEQTLRAAPPDVQHILKLALVRAGGS